VEEAISIEQALHEDSSSSAPDARTGRAHAALAGIAGRVLVKEVNWLGDLVISLPALRAIRAAFATSTLTVMVKKELASFFDGMTWIDEVMPYTVARGIRGIGDRLSIVGNIRAHKFDLAILFPNSFESAFWATLGGARRRAGFGTDHRTAMLTHRARPEGDALSGHQSQYWLAMIRETIGVTPIADADEMKLEVGKLHWQKMRAWLDANRIVPGAPLIAIAPAAAYGPAKEWPPVRYAALIDLITEKTGAECVLVGSPAERELCAKVAATTHSETIVAAGQTDIGDLIALLSVCGGFAGNDSGAMHLASALGIPTVGIFGSTNPERTGPRGPKAGIVYHRLECSPCLERTCRFGHYNCLREITPVEVANKLATLGAFLPEAK
jgi:heptosyltransferase-2